MPQRIIALEIDAAEVRAAVIETTFRDYRVVALHSAHLSVAEGTVEEQIRRFADEHELSGDVVLSALPGDRLTWRTLSLPFRDRKRLVQTIPFELESHVPFDIDDVLIDYQILQQDRDGTTVLAAMVSREELEAHLALMQAVGLDPKVVGVGPLAALNSLRLVPELPPDCSFLAFGARTVTMALYRDGQLAGLRTLTPLRQRPSTEGDGGAANDDNRAAALESLLGEVRWTLLAMNGGPLDEHATCYVAGETVDLNVICPELETALNIDIRRLDETELRVTCAEAGRDVHASTTVVGMALHEVLPAATVGVNFRQGEYTYQRGQQELQRGLRGVAALAAIVVALTVTDLYVDYRQQVSRVRQLDQQIFRVARATLPDLENVRRPTQLLQEEIDLRQQELNILNDIVPVSSSTSIDIFRAVAAAIPNSIRVDADDYMMDADAIRARGNTDSFESVDAIKQRVMSTGFFSDVEVRDARAARRPRTGVDFRLIMQLSKDLRGRDGP